MSFRSATRSLSQYCHFNSVKILWLLPYLAVLFWSHAFVCLSVCLCISKITGKLWQLLLWNFQNRMASLATARRGTGQGVQWVRTPPPAAIRDILEIDANLRTKLYIMWSCFDCAWLGNSQNICWHTFCTVCLKKVVHQTHGDNVVNS